jgi:hypothetical protein
MTNITISLHYSESVANLIMGAAMAVDKAFEAGLLTTFSDAGEALEAYPGEFEPFAFTSEKVKQAVAEGRVKVRYYRTEAGVWHAVVLHIGKSMQTFRDVVYIWGGNAEIGWFEVKRPNPEYVSPKHPKGQWANLLSPLTIGTLMDAVSPSGKVTRIKWQYQPAVTDHEMFRSGYRQMMDMIRDTLNFDLHLEDEMPEDSPVVIDGAEYPISHFMETV